MSLYELTEEIALAEKEVELWAEEHEGDVTDCDFERILGELGDARDDKALNVGVWYKNLLSEENALAEEIKALTYRKKVLANSSKRIKNYLQDLLPQDTKLKNSRCQIGWRKNSAVELSEGITPEELKKLNENLTKTEVDFSKSAIKDEIKTGGMVLNKETPNGWVEIPYMEVEKEDGSIVKFCIPQHKNIQIK